MNRIEDGLSIDDDDEHLRGKESSQGEGCCLYAKTTRLRVSDLNKHKAAQCKEKKRSHFLVRNQRCFFVSLL